MKSSSIVWGLVVSCVLTTGSTLISPLPGQRRCLDMSNAVGEQVLLRCTSTKNIIFSINAMCYTTSSISDIGNRRNNIHTSKAISRISNNSSVIDSTRSTSRGKCGSQCSGHQIEVLASSYDCFWKPECNITWSTAPILKSPSRGCLMKVPSYLAVKYQCVRKKQVFFLSQIAGHGPIHRAHKASDYGMIVSHINYPWVYKAGQSKVLTLSPRAWRRRRRSSRGRTTARRTRRGVIRRKRIRKRRKMTRANKVLVTVDFLDIGQSDAVFVNSSNSSENLVMGSSIVLENTRTFSVQFMVSSESSSRHGFVLCFYWARGCENISGEDACKSLAKEEDKYVDAEEDEQWPVVGMKLQYNVQISSCHGYVHVVFVNTRTEQPGYHAYTRYLVPRRFEQCISVLSLRDSCGRKSNVICLDL